MEPTPTIEDLQAQIEIARLNTKTTVGINIKVREELETLKKEWKLDSQQDVINNLIKVFRALEAQQK